MHAMVHNASGCYHELKVAEKYSKRDVKITNVSVKYQVLAEDYFPQFLKRSNYVDYFYGGIYQKTPFCRN